MSVGWPVFNASAVAREVAIELTSGAGPGFELALLIPNDSAARCVDRALGGNGESGLAGAAGRLSDGECGVLAYLASRACRPFQPLQVCDVSHDLRLGEHVRWPIAFDSALGRVTLSCVLAPWRAEALRDPYRLTVSVFDRGPPSFQAGEVWISDCWNLSSTSEGLAGEVQLSVVGCSSQLSAIVGQGQLRAAAPSSLRDEVELVLSERSLRFLDLARIAAGEPYPVAFEGEVELRSTMGTLARGELVSWRGAIGVRINEA